jgi:large subunit ribosomal protein L7/L12
MAAVSLCCPRLAGSMNMILRNMDRNIYRSRFLLSTSSQNRNEAMPLPSNDKVFPVKIVTIVDQISTLNLLEVADLNSLLKQRLNITDAPVMMAGAGMSAAAAPKEEEEEEAAAPAAVQTNFAVKIKSFDAAKKVGLIKAVKSVMEGMNLVQAKKFVEGLPAVLKEDLAKDEAEKMKETLVAAGAEVDIE